VAFDIILLRHLATKRKKRGERGHPCPSPLPALSKGEVATLMRREKEEELRQFMIKETKL